MVIGCRIATLCSDSSSDSVLDMGVSIITPTVTALSVTVTDQPVRAVRVLTNRLSVLSPTMTECQ